MNLTDFELHRLRPRPWLYDQALVTAINSITGGGSGGGSDVSQLSGNWQSTYTTVLNNSAVWLLSGSNVDLGQIPTLSGNWQSTYTTVNTNSASIWNYQGTDIKGLSGNWERTCSVVQNNSALWILSGTDVDLGQIPYLSGSWNSVYTTVNVNSAINWNYQGTDLKGLSASWDSANTTVHTLSTNWNTAYTTVNANSAAWILSGTDVDLGQIPTLSGDWNSTYTTVNTTSAIWNTISTGLSTALTATDMVVTSGSVINGSFRSSGLFYTFNVNGSAMYLPLYVLNS